MFIAKDIDGNNVTIEEAELFEKENPGIKREYFCPSCKNQVFVKAPKSDKVKTHFAHTKKCSDDWKYDMSEWHRNWQNCFPKECQEVVMRDAQGEIHRADVCINNFVIEFQNSPITADEVEKRNIFYLSLGYNVIWVFNAKDKLKDLDNNIINSTYPYRKFLIGENDLYWKIKNKTFENFKYYQNFGNYAGIYVFLETECNDVTIILPAKILNAKCFDSYITYRPIYRENFLVSFGCMFDEKIETIKELIEETQKIKRKQVMKPARNCIIQQSHSNVRSRLAKGKHRF